MLTFLSNNREDKSIPKATSSAESNVSFLYGAEPFKDKSVSVNVNDGK